MCLSPGAAGGQREGAQHVLHCPSCLVTWLRETVETLKSWCGRDTDMPGQPHFAECCPLVLRGEGGPRGSSAQTLISKRCIFVQP